ncbi:hemerythrin family protein [Sulfurospirillum diekertiae]|uniref:Hemerythrin family protein n=1 Tax=Sulfurospirillum diekertiae TaxID=1854492 RepID=A0A290HRW8_9BACT|nr:hemerythrin family protein [Sulfurospirillum diekertiae]ATB70448.1 hemerythrin-like iron-binding protein [Sulfurospirillum diekertiae]QIR75512.1 hemerythrin family protein [Sulfurospirillum diekertiae]QIR78163.1 hemerythrin family protein [Sulfurospirillum diekertiae]
MIIEWDERYSVHHELLDLQHQELFDLANTVQGLDPNNADKTELSKLFKQFFDYMAKHFKEEEAYMQSIDYPLFEHHKKFHESIILGMTKILKEKKGIVELQKSMKMIAQKWLVEHILENDLKIEKWRKSITVSEDDLHAPLS